MRSLPQHLKALCLNKPGDWRPPLELRNARWLGETRHLARPREERKSAGRQMFNNKCYVPILPASSRAPAMRQLREHVYGFAAALPSPLLRQ
jgi:hypothetical protein